METIDYTTGMLWYGMWPLVIFVAYKFVLMNVEHLEDNLEEKNEKKEEALKVK